MIYTTKHIDVNRYDVKNMDKWAYSYLPELKTLWEIEKLLVTSNFSFSHNVLKSYLLLMRQNEYLWTKGLNSPTPNDPLFSGIYERFFFLKPFPNKPLLFSVYSTSLLKTMWEKEKLHITSNFSFSHSNLYSVGELSPFSSAIKVSSSDSLNLKEYKTCRLEKG